MEVVWFIFLLDVLPKVEKKDARCTRFIQLISQQKLIYEIIKSLGDKTC